MFKKLLPIVAMMLISACTPAQGGHESGMSCCKKCECCASGQCGECCKDGKMSCCKDGSCDMCKKGMSGTGMTGKQCAMDGMSDSGMAHK